MALVGLIAERSGVSTTNLAKLMAFTILPVFIIQPFAGVLIDRWDRKTTLFVCDIARGAFGPINSTCLYSLGCDSPNLYHCISGI